MSEQKKHERDVQEVLEKDVMDYKLKQIRKFLGNIEDYHFDKHYWGVKFNIAHAVNELVSMFEYMEEDPKEIAGVKKHVLDELEKVGV